MLPLLQSSQSKNRAPISTGGWPLNLRVHLNLLTLQIWRTCRQCLYSTSQNNCLHIDRSDASIAFELHCAYSLNRLCSSGREIEHTRSNYENILLCYI